MARRVPQFGSIKNEGPGKVMNLFSSPMLDRRRFLGHTSQGLSGIALASLLCRDGLLAADQTPLRPQIDPARPFASRASHFAPKAKNVLMIFCAGACSQLDTFDYKPELIKRHGEPMPGADGLVTFQGKQGNLTKSPWEFKPRGQCGKMVSDLVPMLGDLADDMCFIHSLTGKTNTHGPGENFMSTGFTLEGFPSVGAWVTWRLGRRIRSCHPMLPFRIREEPRSQASTIGGVDFFLQRFREPTLTRHNRSAI